MAKIIDLHCDTIMALMGNDKELRKSDNMIDIEKLQEVDWLRSNEDWLGRMIRENGKVSNSEEASTLTCSKIKQIIGIELTKEEVQKEKQFVRKK